MAAGIHRRSEKVQSSFFKRLFAGLAIAGPLAYWLATAPLADPRPGSGLPPLTPSVTSHIKLVSMTSAEDQISLARAFASQTSDPIWSGTLLLDRQSPDTIENVRLAAEAVDLTALRPDDMFSFNDVVGIRTEEKGYRPGLMFANGEVVMGIGGGICICSTMLYKAALESGLPIIERHPHSGAVSYADPGRDAAVSYGWADMRFKNDTGAPMLIRAIIEGDELIVALYGANKPGRTVEIASEDYEEIPYAVIEKEDVTIPEGEEKVQQTARAGYSVTTIRLIRQDGKLVSREVMGRDTVLPRNKVVLVPPKRDIPQIGLPFDLPKKAQFEGLPLPTDSDLPLPTSDLTAPSASE